VEQAVRRNVENVSAVWLSSDRRPAPSEAFTIDWLRRNIPQNSNRAVMVHTDCFVHNFLVEDDRIACVLDWECAHFGDPAEDLAYIKAYVAEHMEWDRFVAHYRAAGGQPIVEENIDYYTTLLHFRNFWGCNVGASRADSGFSEVRLIPLGSEHRTRYMGLCLGAAYATGWE
jgi:aminoglycoside phosphotransferase (APT) family kinase protein